MRVSGVGWRAALVLLVALVPRLWIVAQPVTLQLTKSLPDDAYYYFLTAQHIVAGQGASVDGMNPSNGWHPLWMLVTTGVYALPYTDLDTPVRIILALGALCDGLVAVVLYVGARRFVGEAALIGALAYGINAMPILQSVTGLETGLAALMVALAWVMTLRFVETPTPRNAALWGALFGLSFLARTDTALILVWLGVYAALKLLRDRRALPLIAVGGAVALVIVLPWWLWNAANFGSPFDQTSALALPWVIRTRFASQFPGESMLQLGFHSAPIQFWIRGDHLGAPIAAGYLLWLLAAVGLWRSRRHDSRRLAAVTLALLAGGLTLVFVHTFIRLYPRPWYFVVMAQALSLGLALFWAHTGKIVRVVGMAFGTIALVGFGLLSWETGYYGWQIQYHYTSAQWVRENTPPDAVIGSMNAGIIGYYSGRTTVNLDGVVNPAAFRAIQEYRLFDYMREAGIDTFVDIDYILRDEYGMFMGEGYPEGLREIAQISDPIEPLGSSRAYEVLDTLP